MKSKVDKLDVDKLLPVPVDSSKISDVVKDAYNAKIKNIEDKIPDITDLATNTTLNAKINEVKNKVPNITNLAAPVAPTTVENKMSMLVILSEKQIMVQKYQKWKININILLLLIIIS